MEVGGDNNLFSFSVLAYLVLLDRLNKASCVISRMDNDRVTVQQTLVQEQPTSVEVRKQKLGNIHLLARRATERDGWVAAIV